MDLNFKVKGQRLQLLNRNCKLVNKTNSYIHLNFIFEGYDWKHNNHYVILNDENNNSYLYGVHENEPILVPSRLVEGTHFLVGVYGITEGETDDIRITTNVCEIRLEESNYTTNITSVENGSKDIFVQIFNELNHKLDKAEYIVDSVLSDTSVNPVQNKVIKEALENVTPTNLARVAYTGDFQDLNDKAHTHRSTDVTDLGNSIEDDVDLFCRTLADLIRM